MTLISLVEEMPTGYSYGRNGSMVDMDKTKCGTSFLSMLNPLKADSLARTSPKHALCPVCDCGSKNDLSRKKLVALVPTPTTEHKWLSKGGRLAAKPLSLTRTQDRTKN